MRRGGARKTAQEFNRQPLQPESTAATALSRIDFILLDVQSAPLPGHKTCECLVALARRAETKGDFHAFLGSAPSRRDGMFTGSAARSGIVQQPAALKREAVSLPSNSGYWLMKSLFSFFFLTPLPLMRLHRTILKLFSLLSFFFFFCRSLKAKQIKRGPDRE